MGLSQDQWEGQMAAQDRVVGTSLCFTVAPQDIILAHYVGHLIGPAHDGMCTKVGDIGILSHLSQGHALPPTSDQQRDTGLLYRLARQTSLLCLKRSSLKGELLALPQSHDGL